MIPKILSDESGNNRWSAVINTTGFWQGEYIIIASSKNDWILLSIISQTAIPINSIREYLMIPLKHNLKGIYMLVKMLRTQRLFKIIEIFS